MNIALNIAALLLVIGISWFGVIWLAGFFHKGIEEDGLGLPDSDEERF
mgnify:CR=1 FL=1|tara:strand:- start:112 stop:255 length:144 start_codon:yes stop_codon:yes gene_type:complete